MHMRCVDVPPRTTSTCIYRRRHMLASTAYHHAPPVPPRQRGHSRTRKHVQSRAAIPRYTLPPGPAPVPDLPGHGRRARDLPPAGSICPSPDLLSPACTQPREPRPRLLMDQQTARKRNKKTHTQLRPLQIAVLRPCAGERAAVTRVSIVLGVKIGGREFETKRKMDGRRENPGWKEWTEGMDETEREGGRGRPKTREWVWTGTQVQDTGQNPRKGRRNG
ncbi:hypothetical protein C8R44DRAFT_17467 [Mycena epipterygia]|nr:hypothetical protein C8R44DRAFT_17467 [Mycena epipterygia]